ncbi:protein kinase [Mycobacterium frederiksbergense]|uniref:protein kinase domain-containing protein n=1 Tax=Mycolicibacterium frederiksbergense TaxID=117567 RepID=UPI0021F2BF1A|nr:protein kinase [Mycolicibacterium frederiksbergense]MCV7048388.1 protein kinase [Mycolicibacterium frederiksbergense]
MADDVTLLRLDYECLRSIPGGLNEVRLWWDDQLGCHRVGKRYDTACVDDVLPEPATLQMIDHPNVVGVVAAGVIEDKKLYPPPMRVIELITPYFPRGSITDALLRGERFTCTRAVQIVQAILRGLATLHDVHEIAHRDLKSGNVLLTDDSDPAVAKICDLGLAGLFDDSGTVPALNNPTLYSPPEFKSGAPLSQAADLVPRWPHSAGAAERAVRLRQLSDGRHRRTSTRGQTSDGERGPSTAGVGIRLDASIPDQSPAKGSEIAVPIRT